jgi:hypothetical protein
MNTRTALTVGGKSVVSYSNAEYEFPTAVADLLGVEPDLSRLRPDQPVSVRVRADDQKLPWHSAFYANFARLAPLYRKFVTGVVAEVLPGPFYYQAVPTFRVHLPGNLAVGEFHTDRRFGHPNGEITFWVPLTPAFGTNSLLVETGLGTGRFDPVIAGPGQVFVFDAGNLEHGNVLNDTGATRASFDFRCLPVERYEPTAATTVNTGMRFEPGDYYAPEAVAGLG